LTFATILFVDCIELGITVPHRRARQKSPGRSTARAKLCLLFAQPNACQHKPSTYPNVNLLNVNLPNRQPAQTNNISAPCDAQQCGTDQRRGRRGSEPDLGLRTVPWPHNRPPQMQAVADGQSSRCTRKDWKSPHGKAVAKKN
jgi:hypothetical protein